MIPGRLCRAGIDIKRWVRLQGPAILAGPCNPAGDWPKLAPLAKFIPLTSFSGLIWPYVLWVGWWAATQGRGLAKNLGRGRLLRRR